MRVRFTTDAVTEQELQEAVGTEGIGYESDFLSNAALTMDAIGRLVWTTAWSQFTYTLLKVENGKSFWEYEGAQNGFLAQNLIPSVLKNADCQIYGDRGEGVRLRCLENGNPMPDGPSEVSWVKGSYGVFHGHMALEQYAMRKEARRAA